MSNLCKHKSSTSDVEARKYVRALAWDQKEAEYDRVSRRTHEARGLNRDYHWSGRVQSWQAHWNRP